MADLRQRWNEFKGWWLAGRALWVMILALAALYLLTYNFPAEKLFPDTFKDSAVEFADRVRWLGILLEIGSISTIAYGLSQSMAAFNKPKLVSRFFHWIGEFRYVFIGRPPINATAHGQSLGIVTSVAVGTVLIKAGTVEEQLEQLRQSVDALKNGLAEVRVEVGQLDQATKKGLADESKERQLTDRKLSESIEQQKIGDVHIQVAGLALLVLSIFLANAPTESSAFLRLLGLGNGAYW